MDFSSGDLHSTSFPATFLVQQAKRWQVVMGLWMQLGKKPLKKTSSAGPVLPSPRWARAGRSLLTSPLVMVASPRQIT